MAPTAFRDDSTRVMHVIVLSVFSFLALIAVLFRLWARKIQKNIWELNDYLIIVGLIWALAETVFTMHSNIYWNLGANITQIGNPEAIRHLVMIQGKALLVGQITWAVAVFFIRASILALYIRVFTTQSFRIACYVTHGINAAFFISTVLAVCLICRPISFNWNHRIPGGACGDQRSLDLYLGIFNLLTDVTVVALPMPVLWGLQMAVNKKIVLSGMFGLGIIICIITLIRTRISAENVGSNAQSIYSLVALFTCLEALLGVINACLPVMKPVFTKLASYKGSPWLSSIMSGSIPIFIRPSQIGSHWRSKSRHSDKRDPTSKNTLPKEMPLVPRWPSSSNHLPADDTSIKGAQRSPPPRYVDSKPAKLMFASSAYDPVKDSPLESPRPPVPPKSKYYSPMRRREPVEEEEDLGFVKGIRVRKEWDVERERSEETDRQGLVRSDGRW